MIRTLTQRPPLMRRLGSLAFALALLIPQAVSAAPAYLRADHNPVIVQPRQTTGNFTLSWSSGTAIVPALYVNYGGLDQSVPITAATGTLVEQAIIGVTSTYKLYASSAKAQLLASLPVSAALAMTVIVNPNRPPTAPTPSGDFAPTGVVTRFQDGEAYNNAIYCGLSVRGIAGSLNPPPGAVNVGYENYWDPGSDPFPCWEGEDTFWRAGLQFDQDLLKSYVQAHGLVTATLRFRMTGSQFSCLARLDQATQDMTGWVPDAGGVILSDGAGMNIPVGPLASINQWPFKESADGHFEIDVTSMVRPWVTYADSVGYGFVLVSGDESLPRNNVSCTSVYTDFQLTLTPAR